MMVQTTTRAQKHGRPIPTQQTTASIDEHIEEILTDDNKLISHTTESTDAICCWEAQAHGKRPIHQNVLQGPQAFEGKLLSGFAWQLKDYTFERDMIHKYGAVVLWARNDAASAPRAVKCEFQAVHAPNLNIFLLGYGDLPRAP